MHRIIHERAVKFDFHTGPAVSNARDWPDVSRKPGVRRTAEFHRAELRHRRLELPAHKSRLRIGSPRVTHDVAEAIRAAVPELSYGAEVVFDGVALVDMRGRSVGEWEVIDRISLAESNCDS